VIDYAYDALSRRMSGTWYDDLTDAEAQQNARKTYATTYDAAGRLSTVGDGDYDFAYTWSIFGNLTSTTQELYGLTDDVLLTYAYDVLGRKTSVAAKVGETDDYVNSYAYDNPDKISRITQDSVSGGNAVAEKRVDFGYSDDATRATVARFADLAGTKAVAETEQVFDHLGRVTDIVHERAALAGQLELRADKRGAKEEAEANLRAFAARSDAERSQARFLGPRTDNGPKAIIYRDLRRFH